MAFKRGCVGADARATRTVVGLDLSKAVRGEKMTARRVAAADAIGTDTATLTQNELFFRQGVRQPDPSALCPTVL